MQCSFKFLTVQNANFPTLQSFNPLFVRRSYALIRLFVQLLYR